MTIEIIRTEINIVEMIEGTLWIETGHMTEGDAEMQMIVTDVGRREERVDLEKVIHLTLGTKVMRQGVITSESQDM